MGQLSKYCIHVSNNGAEMADEQISAGTVTKLLNWIARSPEAWLSHDTGNVPFKSLLVMESMATKFW